MHLGGLKPSMSCLTVAKPRNSSCPHLLQDAARLPRGARASSWSPRQGHHDPWHEQRAKCRKSQQQQQLLLWPNFPGRRCTSSIILSNARKAPAANLLRILGCATLCCVTASSLQAMAAGRHSGPMSISVTAATCAGGAAQSKW